MSIFLTVTLFTAQCAPEAQKIIVQTVEVEVPVEKEVIVTKIVERTVTEIVEVEVEIIPVEKTEIEFWTTDNETDQLKVYEDVAARWMEKNPDYEVRIVPVEEEGLSQRIATAFDAERLPDIIRMGIENISAFVAEGILDEDAANAVIESVGKGDFRAGSLAMVINPGTGNYTAVPFDGWIQSIWYRTDIFEEAGLEAPTTWETLRTACETLPGTGNLLYALGLGTDPGQNYGHQIFEQVAISNNAWPFDEAGTVTMNTSEMVAALQFYTDLQTCAIPGPQYWSGAREAYELGQTGMLFYNTYIMDDLVEGSGMENGERVQIAVEDLAFNSGFAPELVGPNGSASYGQLNTLALIQGAEPASRDLVKFFLTEGYLDVLALAPFGKIPVTKSAVDGWKGLSPFFENYSDQTLDQIVEGYETMQSWRFRPVYNATQRSVIADIEGRLLIPQVISKIALEGTMTPETGAEWLQEQVEGLLAEHQTE